jgi:hypothetical protein
MDVFHTPFFFDINKQKNIQGPSSLNVLKLNNKTCNNLYSLVLNWKNKNRNNFNYVTEDSCIIKNQEVHKNI